MEYCIVYLSASKGLLPDDELATILKQSQRNNKALGVTGMFLYLNGSILQVLEGEEEHVKAVYNKISKDPRHVSIVALFNQEISARNFPEWSMGFSTLSGKDLDKLPTLQPLIKNPFLEVSETNPVLNLIQTFYKNNYRN